METLVRQIALYIQSRYPIIYLVTSEENRAVNLVQKAAQLTKKQCYLWSVTDGYYNTDKFGKDKTPLNALNAILNYSEPGLFVLKDFHPYLEEPVIIRRLRDIVANLKKSYKTLLIISYQISGGNFAEVL